jgi:endonuclease YncB( thermonuclease family)
MSIQHPRRIFKSSYSQGKPRQFGRTVLVGAALAIIAAGLSMTGLSTDLFGRAPPPSETLSAQAGQVAVIDGETLRLGMTVIRLVDLQAPARGEACAAGPDCGARATDALASLVRNRQVQCRLGGHDDLGRPMARCDAGGSDINRDLVATGWARASTAALAGAEGDARSHNRGLWAANFGR